MFVQAQTVPQRELAGSDLGSRWMLAVSNVWRVGEPPDIAHWDESGVDEEQRTFFVTPNRPPRAMSEHCETP